MMIGKLSEFNVKTGNWSLYVERFEIFCRTNKIDEELRLPSLISAIGDEAYELLSVLSCPDNPCDMSYSDVVKTMAGYLKPPSFVAERCRFRDRKQQVEETVLQYLSELKTLSKQCDFKDTLLDNLRDQFVYGLKDKQLKKKLLDQQNLDYFDTIRISCETEMSSKAKSPLLSAGNVERIALEDCENAPPGQMENDSLPNGDESVLENRLSQLNSELIHASPKNAQDKQFSRNTENCLTPNNAQIDCQPLKSAQDGQPPKTSQEKPLNNGQVEDLKWTADKQPPNNAHHGQAPKSAQDQQSPKSAQNEQKTPKDVQDGPFIKNTPDNQAPNNAHNGQAPKSAQDQQPPKNALKENPKDVQDGPSIENTPDNQPPKNALDQQPSKSSRFYPSDLRNRILYDEEDLTIDEIVQGLQDPDMTTKSAAARAARLMSLEVKPNIEYFIKSGLVQLLIEAVVRKDCQKLQLEAASAINNIAIEATLEQMLAVIDTGAIPKLISVIPQGGEITEQVVLALGLANISDDGAYFRIIMDNGALPVMLPFMTPNTPINILRATVWTYAGFCRNMDESLDFQLIAPGLPYIAELLLVSDEQVLEDSCSALCFISKWGENFIEEVQTTPKLLSRLITLLRHNSSNVKIDALRVVTNMLAGSDMQKDRCLDAQCLTSLVPLLSSYDFSIVREASRAVSNILSGTEYQVQRALNAGILTHLHKVMAHQDFPYKEDAAQGITNLCLSRNPDQLKLLIKSDCLEPYCRLITSNDLEAVSKVLDGLTDLTWSAETNVFLDILSSKFQKIRFKQTLEQTINDLKQKRDRINQHSTILNADMCKKLHLVIDTMSKLLNSKALMLAVESTNDFKPTANSELSFFKKNNA